MRVFAVGGIVALLVSGTMRAQAPQAGAAPTTGAITGLMHAIHATNNVDTTLAFYTRLFGVMGQVQPFTNPNVPILTNSPGVTLRLSMLRLPSDEPRGMGFELTEFSNVERHPAQPQVCDPGAPHMKFLVKDIAPVMTAIKANNVPIITRSKAPVKYRRFSGRPPRSWLRSDGYLVEVLQVTPPAGAPDGNLIGSMPGETIADLEKSQKFWRDIMGLHATGDQKFARDKAMLDFLGLPDGAESA